MSETDDLQRELMTIFQVELEEHLGTLSKGLLALEEGPSPEMRARLLADLFRAAHSLKGAARAVGLRNIEALAHHLEDALDAIRQDQQAWTSPAFDVLLAATDAIQAEMAAYLRGEQLPPEQLHSLYVRLEAASTGQLPPAQATAPEAGALPLESPTGDATSLSPTELLVAAPVQPNDGLPAAPPTPPAPVPEHSARPGPAPYPAAGDDTIRVATSKLDALMDTLGELLVVRMRSEQMLEQILAMRQRLARWQKSWRSARPHYDRVAHQARTGTESEINSLLEFLARHEAELKGANAELNRLVSRATHDRNNLQLVADELQSGIRNIRMLPVATLFDLFPRMVRDLAHDRGKEIALQLEGAETEVDRLALELMKDPLTHLLRNAIDHGFEGPEQRVAAGKPRRGTLRLAAEQRGNQLILTVADDGRGIDLEAVRSAAVVRGVRTAADIATLTDRETLELIFRSGLSTAGQLTDISGRGVGLDVVRENLEQLRGLIHVDTHPGLGTTFTLTLPLTLATSQVLLVRAAQETLALPTMNVERILRVSLDQVGNLGGQPTIFAEDQPLPLVSLAQVLNLPAAERPLAPHTRIPVVIMGVVEKRIALRVDGFVSTQEVVIKPLGRQLRRVRNVAGATILGDGQIVIILNVADLMKSIQGMAHASSAMPVATLTTRRRRVLVADDSITTRTLEKHILENAGYQVMAAADGQEAWELIRSHDSDLPDLVVSDVNMPKMDGIALTESIRGNERYSRLPVVLVTSQESPEDKIRGLDAGADAYIVKSTFDQRALLEAIERLIG